MKYFLLTISFLFIFQTGELFSQEYSNGEYTDRIRNELKSNNPGRNSNRTYDIDLKSNGYLYSYSYYDGKKVGESRIHIEDIASIDYQEGMGELYLKLLCKDSKDCSLWNNYGDDTVFNYMLLRVIDSRSGDYIKKNIRGIVLNETGFDLNKKTNLNYYKADNSREVYFCDSRSAYAYHSRLNCNGLSNCQYQIYSISEKGAREKGFRYCDICWE